jgi:hypothetical protein
MRDGPIYLHAARRRPDPRRPLQPVLVSRLPREDQVDRVLGEDRDEGEERDRECLRYLELGELGPPRQKERRSEDRQAEQQRVDLDADFEEARAK